MPAMKVLISGAGIAGPTLAYWLSRYGFEPTTVEKAPRLRTGGYIIDFWGTGFEIADRMELLPEISRNGYTIQELRVVDSSGRKVAAFLPTQFLRFWEDASSAFPAETWRQRSSARLNLPSRRFLAIACPGLSKTRSEFASRSNAERSDNLTWL